jgi:hypothetical protein
MFKFFVLMALAFTWSAQSALAQDDIGTGGGTSAVAGTLSGDQLEKLVIKRDPKIITDGYIETTFPNLVNAYWAVAKFDIDDDKAIDDYMMITNCDIYKQYFNNDFEWDKVRTAARQYLTTNAAKLPTRFEAMLPIQLDKYDPKSQQFKIRDKYQQHNLVRIDVITNVEGEAVCDYKETIPLYPKNIVVLLNRPFSVKAFPVNPEVAELYLKEMAIKPLLGGQQRRKLLHEDTTEDRPAYLRLKLRLAQYKETITKYNFHRAVIYAYLEGWDVYADEMETKPLYVSQFKKREAQTGVATQLGVGQKEYNPMDRKR